MTRNSILAILILPCLGTLTYAQDLAKAIGPFVAAHCVDCHGPDIQKSGLRLDNLNVKIDDEHNMAAWTKVFDKVHSGQMPPKEREKPDAKELTVTLDTLRKELHSASIAQQQKKGRVVVRRMNTTEYENTVRELLGTNVPLKEMLPEDNAAGGFDNISTQLDLSPNHLLLYQDAAERAINSVAPMHPNIPFSAKATGKLMSDRGSNFRQTLDRSCRLQGDALIVYSKLPRYGLCSTVPVNANGRYKVKMSIAAVGEASKPVAVAFMTVGQGRDEPALIEMRDIEPGQPKVIEYEVELTRRQQFVLNMLTHWDIRATKKSIEEYKGPGFMLEWMSIEGPLDEFPPKNYNTLFAEVPLKARSVVRAEAEGRKAPTIAANRPEQQWQNDPLVPHSANPKVDAERLLKSFIPKAFRRPVPDELIQLYVKRVHEKLDSKYSFYDAMMYGYKAILSSPHFLLFVESTSKLDDYALANRLAYFLWSSLPDEELLTLAKKGELSKPETLKAQTERMLKSPKAKQFTYNFTGQWLDLRKMEATIPDPQLYGDYDGSLGWAMPRETWNFFDEMIRGNRNMMEFVDSDWTYLNERLAKHYGIPGIEGNDFHKVTLPKSAHRGGVMTHASVLKVTADGTRTSPVIRGKWILERIIGLPPDPPPPDVPAIEPDIRGATTIRQQLDKHRNIAACATCHVHIDPPGFALENYDPIGGWRDYYRATARTKGGIVNLPGYTGRAFYRGPDVEKGGITHDGKKFDTMDDYKKILLDDKDQLARNLTQKMMVYATGAEIQFADREVVEAIVAKLKKENYGFRSLIHEVVQSRVFLNK
jgi:hypothetical protein